MKSSLAAPTFSENSFILGNSLTETPYFSKNFKWADLKNAKLFLVLQLLIYFGRFFFSKASFVGSEGLYFSS